MKYIIYLKSGRVINATFSLLTMDLVRTWNEAKNRQEKTVYTYSTDTGIHTFALDVESVSAIILDQNKNEGIHS